MPNSKPLVAAAFACEKVLVEKDGVLSAIRIVDTFKVPPLPEGVPTEFANIQVSALVALKSGDIVGEHEISLQLRTPDGKTTPLNKWPVLFTGGEQGINLNISFNIPVAAFGMYWLDVVWKDDVLTSAPIKVVEAPPDKIKPPDRRLP